MTSLQQQQHHQHQSWSQQLSDENAVQADQHQHQDAADRQDADDIHQPDNNSGTNSAPPVRKRTRATADQLSVLEDTFAVNVSPNSKLRKQLAEQLQMSERSIQIWFQNRRAKVKHMQKRAQMQMHQASIRAQLYQYHQQQQQQYGQPLLPMQPNSSAAAAAAAAAAGIYQHPYYYSNAATRLAIPTRAQSVDAVQYNNARVLNVHQQVQPQPQDMLFTPASSVPPPPSTTTGTQYSATPPPMSYPQYYGHHQPGSAASSSSSWPAHLQDDLPLTRQSMPPQVYPYDFSSSSVEPSSIGMEFPEYLHGQVSPSPSPLHQQQKLNATIPTLVSVPDAGPTAILATSLTQSTTASNHNSPTPAATLSTSPEATTNLGLSTIDPSNLMMPSAGSVDESINKESSATPDNTSVKDESLQQLQQPVETEHQQQQQEEDEEPKDLYLSATTLTIGTWHRLKMHETDLVCVYRPDTRIFAWHIVDGGCHFKMEVAQNAVSSIEFVLDEHEALADVHFDISEPPLFYMESTTTTTTTIPLDETSTKKKTSNSKKNEKDDTSTAEETEQEKTIEIPSPMWVQCSDFTEGKQASRFFRHTLKGVAHHMKQELLALTHNHEETRRLVHFIEPQQYNLMYQPIVESQSSHPHQHPHHHAHNHPHHIQHQPQHHHHHIQQHSPTNEDHLLMQAAAAGFMNPNMYWPSQPVSEPIACELYMN